MRDGGLFHARFEAHEDLILLDQLAALDFHGFDDSVDTTAEVDDHVRFDDAIEFVQLLPPRRRLKSGNTESSAAGASAARRFAFDIHIDIFTRLFHRPTDRKNVIQALILPQQVFTRACMATLHRTLRGPRQCQPGPMSQPAFGQFIFRASPRMGLAHRQIHDLVLPGKDCLDAAGIALAGAPSEQLPVDTPRLVALRGDDVQAAGPR